MLIPTLPTHEALPDMPSSSNTDHDGRYIPYSSLANDVYTIDTASIVLTDGQVRLINGPLVLTNDDIRILNGQLEVGDSDIWTAAGAMTVTTSFVLDSLTINTAGYTDTAGTMSVTGMETGGAGGTTISFIGAKTTGVAATGGAILLQGGEGSNAGVGGSVTIRGGAGAVSAGNVILAHPVGNVSIGLTDADAKVEIMESGIQLKLSADATDYITFQAFATTGNLNIRSSRADYTIDVDDGNFTTTGAMNVNTLTVGDGGTTDYFSVNATGDGQFFGAGDLLVGNDRFFARSTSAPNVGIFFQAAGASQINITDSSGNAIAFFNAGGNEIRLNDFTVVGGPPTELVTDQSKDKCVVFRDGSNSAFRRCLTAVIEVSSTNSSKQKTAFSAFAYTTDGSTMALSETIPAGLLGGRLVARIVGDGLITAAGGISAYTEALAASASNVTDAFCFQAEGIVGAGAGTIANAHAIWVRNGSGTITNYYGLHIDDITAGGTLNYPIFQEGTNGLNIFRAESRFGSSSNFSKFETGGTLEFNGDATVFEDIVISLDSAKVPAANAPTWSGFISNLNAFTYGINDFQEFTSEIAHSYKEASIIEFHIHGATNGQEGSDKTIKFEIEYELVDNNISGVFGDAYTGTTIINGEITIPLGTADKTAWAIDVGDDTTGNFLQAASIKGRIRRIASSGAEPASDPFVLQVGIHIEQDTVGSRTELTK